MTQGAIISLPLQATSSQNFGEGYSDPGSGETGTKCCQCKRRGHLAETIIHEAYHRTCLLFAIDQTNCTHPALSRDAYDEMERVTEECLASADLGSSACKDMKILTEGAATGWPWY
jgi:hypothetical protein